MIINEDGLITENQNIPQLENIEETTGKYTQNEIFDLNSNELDKCINLNNSSINSNLNDSNLYVDPNLYDSQIHNITDISQGSQEPNELQSPQDIQEPNILQSSQDTQEPNESHSLQDTHEEPNISNPSEINCLALTVRKDYNLSIIKNGFFTTLRVSWKVAVSTFVLGLLKFLF